MFKCLPLFQSLHNFLLFLSHFLISKNGGHVCFHNIHAHASQLRFAHSKPKAIHSAVCTLSLLSLSPSIIIIIITVMIISDIIQYFLGIISTHTCVRCYWLLLNCRWIWIVEKESNPIQTHTHPRIEIYDALI